MSDSYTPPKVWTWDKASGGKFANINRPISGATSEKDLPVGKHPLQLYSLATPNGVKVTVMLEELLAKGHTGAEYDACGKWEARLISVVALGISMLMRQRNSNIRSTVSLWK